MLPREGFARVDIQLRKSSRNAGAYPAVQRYFIVKRTVDVLGALALMIGLLPLLGILVGLVALQGGHPFYGQRRLGRDGKSFMLWKLRTMVPEADKALTVYLEANPAAQAEWDSTQKLRHDPRVTAIGWFLRKYSLDELPQLINVLSGEMSLIGPRPMMIEQRSLYPGVPYCNLRPGLSGLWQVSERNGCTFAARAEFDRRYAETLSLALDLKILLKTVVVIFRGTGC